MRKNFERALDVTLVYEGGYSNDPRDPGGPTNMGVTQKTLAAWRGEPVSAADVKALTLDEARKIYKAQYWDRVRADRLPTGVDFAVFDYAVNSGPARAIKALQTVVGVRADGVIGEVTMAAVRTWEPDYIVKQFQAQRLAFLQRLGTWRYYKNGWTKRVDHVRKTALAWLAQEPAPTPESLDTPKGRDEDVSVWNTSRGRAAGAAGLGIGTNLLDTAGVLTPLQDISPIVRGITAVIMLAAVGFLLYDLLRDKQKGNLADAA